MTPEAAADVLLIPAAVMANASVAVYALVPWWRSAWGKHVMTYMLSVALVLDLGLIRLGFAKQEWFQWVRVGSYALLVIALCWRLLMLIEGAAEFYIDRSDQRDAVRATEQDAQVSAGPE